MTAVKMQSETAESAGEKRRAGDYAADAAKIRGRMKQIFSSPRLTAAFVALVLLVSGYAAWKYWRRPPGVNTENAGQTAPTPVVALGRVVPGEGAVRLSAPSSFEGNRIEKLLVTEGERVESGQVVAVLDSRDRLRAALDEARRAARVREATLDRVRAGAPAGRIEAQNATVSRLETERRRSVEAQTAVVARLEAEVRNAKTEHERDLKLYASGDVSAAQRDRSRLVY